MHLIINSASVKFRARVVALALSAHASVVTIVAAFAIAVMPMQAQAAPPAECKFDAKEFKNRQLAKINFKGPQFLPEYLLAEPKLCPPKGACAWRKKDELPQGMKVLVGPTFGTFTCIKRVVAASQKTYIGWVLTDKLKRLEQK